MAQRPHNRVGHTIVSPDDVEISDAAYLSDFANRLMRVPVMHGTDQYDVDRLTRMSRTLEEPHA